MSIKGQENGLIGYLMLSTLYTTVCLTNYQKPTNPGNNPSYTIRATQVAHKSIKDTWERDPFEFITAIISNIQSESKFLRRFA